MAGDGAPSRLLMGRIGAAHGIKGEVRIATFTGDPLAIAGYGPLETNRPGLVVTITSARQANTVIIARIKGVPDRNSAETLNGVELFLDRDRLPEPEDEDDFYHADLIGLTVRLTDGVEIGQVIAIPNFGAGDILEVRNPRNGETFLYPFTRKVVPEVHVKAGYLVIDPPTETEAGDEEPN